MAHRNAVSVRPLAAALSAVLAAFAGQAAAESFRLAYSQAEGVEIFVEHEAGTPWCAPALEMRAVIQSGANEKALERLMPKLGALLGQQCPAAQQLSWTSVNEQGAVLARGTSSAATQWQAAVTAPIQQEEAIAQARVQPAPVEAKVEAEAPTPAEVQTSAEAPTPTATSAPAAPDPSPARAPAAPTQAPAIFAVNGWQPGEHAQVLADATFLQTRTDQNGCKVVTSFRDVGDERYLALRSSGLACEADGYASGRGSLEIVRSDGAVVASLRDAWFTAGIPMNVPLAQARLAAASADGRALWFHLGGDPATQTQYLLRATRSYDTIMRWLVGPTVDVITAQTEAFREVGSIREHVMTAARTLSESAMPQASSARLVFYDGFDSAGILDSWILQQDHRLYETQVNRRIERRSGQSAGPWQFEPRNANNHLFARDARLAEEKKRAEQQAERERQRELARQASKEREHLREFERLTKLQQQNPAALLAELEQDVAYRVDGRSGYTRLVAGGEAAVSRIIRVTGRDGEDAKADWPYDLRVTGQRGLDKGWYLVRGKASLDRERRDAEGLPLTRIRPDEAGVLACAEQACRDRADPLAVVRQRSGNPEWTPESARQTIADAPAGSVFSW